MMPALSVRNLAIAALLIALVLVPVFAELIGNRFVLTLFTRIIILAIAASRCSEGRRPFF